VHALALLAEFAAEAGRIDNLGGHLERLENELSILERQPGSVTTTAWLQGATTSAVLRWRISSADPFPAMRKIAAIARSARNADAASLDARAPLLLAYADFANVAGAPLEARAVLDEAAAILRCLQEPSVDLRVRLPIAQAAYRWRSCNPFPSRPTEPLPRSTLAYGTG
jgi:hypothetical protein